MTYNSFDSLYHYYSEMSAMGDREPEFQLFGPAGSASPGSEWGRIGNVSVPFAVLQALDDPLVGWRTVGTSDPQGLADSGSGNIMLLLTKAGGHVVRFFEAFVMSIIVGHYSVLTTPLSILENSVLTTPLSLLEKLYYEKGLAIR